MDFKQWEGFDRAGEWTKEIDVRGFIQANYTPYDGDESFLVGPTEKSTKLWNKIQALYEEEREKAETIGYYAMFEYLNGFRKTIYWSKQKMEAHALKYSMGYRAKKGYTFWEKDFDGMAYKTMLRQLISKWGIMSIDLTMQKALESDMAGLNYNRN